MKKASNKFFYKVECDILAPGLGYVYESALLTLPEFKEFKECVNKLSWEAFFDSKRNFPADVKRKVAYWKKRIVTKRYYHKYKSVLNEKPEISCLLSQLNDYIDKKQKKKGQRGKKDQNKYEKEDSYEDGPYHQLDCVFNFNSLDITATITLSNTDFLAFKKNHDKKKSLFCITKDIFGDEYYEDFDEDSDGGDSGGSVYLKSWKAHVISKEDYEFLCKGLHAHECAKKFLKKIEKWVSADEQEEIAEFIEANNLSDDEDEVHEVESDSEEDEDDEAEIEEKPLEKKVKKH